MELTRPRTKIGISTTSGKVLIVQRFLEYQRAERLRIMRGIAGSLAEKTRRVFITPRRTILRVPPLPPKLQAVLDAVEAAERGDYAPLRRLVRERLGEPDALAVLALRDAGDEVPFRVMDEFIRDARPYITKASYDDTVPELVDETLRGIRRRYVEKAVEHQAPGRDVEIALRALIASIGYAEGWGRNLIAKRIRQEGPERPDKPAESLDDRIVMLGETDEDLDWIVAVRFLDDLAVRADLDERTTLAFLLSARGYSGEEIAEKLGTSHSNARKLMQRGRARLAPFRDVS